MTKMCPGKGGNQGHRANEPYHNFKLHDLHLRYMNACAEAVILIEESLRMEDDLK